jgi:uncharacterized protein (TIGR02453 family)
MTSPFTKKTLSFLRALKRNNDREWFRLHKLGYEEYVRGPMIALVQQLATDLPSFAPELIADSRLSLYRIYRDTRFSENKSPLKTHVAARFPAKGFVRHEGACAYVHVAPDGVWIGGGLYMPPPSDLRTIREHVAKHHTALRRIVNATSFRQAVGELSGEQLSTAPRGYRGEHPAAAYLRFKQFLAGREFEASFATDDGFYHALLGIFRAVAPLIRYLNTPLLEQRRGIMPTEPSRNRATLPSQRQSVRRPPARASTS